jgi:hypothetical protein
MTVYMTDYNQITTRINAEDWVMNKGVKEIWIWGYQGSKVGFGNPTCRALLAMLVIVIAILVTCRYLNIIMPFTTIIWEESIYQLRPLEREQSCLV